MCVDRGAIRPLTVIYSAPMPDPAIYSLYLHIPFCRHKCSYCDFNTYAGLDDQVAPYVDALCGEIAAVRAAAGGRLWVHTVYFGGGTPSLLPIRSVRQIVRALRDAFALEKGAEITLEANPGTLTSGYLRGLRALGVNRLSVGMQSACPEELALLERQHDVPAVIEVLRSARLAEFENVSLDLIFGLPGQTFESWRRSLDMGIRLRPDHFSLYALTLEGGTPMEGWVRRGSLEAPDPDLAADMYEWAAERLHERGFEQYEISNWARAGEGDHRCRHNLQYWRNRPYLGLGAGAHGFAAGFRTANVRAPGAYIRCFEAPDPARFPRTPATASVRRVSRYTEMQETMLMGLRLTEEGVAASDFAARFGLPLREVFSEEVADLVDAELLAWSSEGEVLRLTPRGRLLANRVFERFV